MENRWIIDRVIELAKVTAQQAEQIRQLEQRADDRDERDDARDEQRWPTIWQMLTGLGSIGAILVSIFYKGH